MKKLTMFIITLLFAAGFSGCRGPEHKPAKVVAAADESQGKASLLTFVKALQNSDKSAAYAASNLTPELVEESRKKLVDQPVKKLTKQQVTEAENALRMSSSIELYLKKMKTILLKSAAIEVVKSGKWSAAAPNVLMHEVKITFTNQKESLSDDTGKSIKEFILRFQQIQYEVNGRLLQEFLIEDKAFENLLNRKLEVKSYF